MVVQLWSKSMTVAAVLIDSFYVKPINISISLDQLFLPKVVCPSTVFARFLLLGGTHVLSSPTAQ